MTEEQLLSRLSELNKAKESAIANANVIVGQIQECQNWLKFIKSHSPPVLVPLKSEGQ